jgi:DNA repair exonuclease SbcCD ATPase subunit
MSRIDELYAELKKYENQIEQCNGVIQDKSKKIIERQNAIQLLEQTKSANLLKKAILTEACKQIRTISSDVFSQISTTAVQQILGDHLSVKIIQGERGGVPTAEFKICAQYDDYYLEVEPTDEESGGGVADVVSLANLLTINVLNREQNSAPIILDEPTKFVSVGNADKVGEFIRQMARDFNKQIIMVTHSPDTAMHANKTIHVQLDNEGKSVVTVTDNN